MKYSNIRFTAIATYSNGTMSDCRAFATEKAMSNWANRQYRKDEGTIIHVYEGFTDKLYCVYSA